MDIIRRYIPNINDSEDKHTTCEEIMIQFMANYSKITEESDSLFIPKYFMSAILAFCAEIHFKNYQLLETFIRFFIAKQSGIWDIWSVFDFEDRHWVSIEKCLRFELKNIRNKSGFYAMKYIIEMTHKLDIEFTDPNDFKVKMRFIDWPRFDSMESRSELWRNLHRPVIDCTLLPVNPQILRLLLQFGATVPTLDYHVLHVYHRISSSLSDDASIETLIKNLFWIRFVTIDVFYGLALYKKLSLLGNQIIKRLINQKYYCRRESLLDTIPVIPSLKQMARYLIRERLRAVNRLPESIADLEIHSNLKQFLNLEIL